MKQLLTLLTIVCFAIYGYAQQNYHYETLSAITTFDGRGDKAQLLATVYDNVDDGEQLYSSFYTSQGYDSHGGNSRNDYVRVTVTDANGTIQYLDYIQISDQLERSGPAQEIINPMSNMSSAYAASICSQQYGAVKRARRNAKSFEIKRSLPLDNTVYQAPAISNSNESPATNGSVIINNYPCGTCPQGTTSDPDIPPAPSNPDYGTFGNGTYGQNAGYGFQNQPNYPNDNFGQCTYAKDNFPHLYQQYLSTGKKNVFNILSTQQRKAAKKCVTGKTWFGRNWPWVIPAGLALGSTTAYLLSNRGQTVRRITTDPNNPNGPDHNDNALNFSATIIQNQGFNSPGLGVTFRLGGG